jgi:uncharacterized protein
VKIAAVADLHCRSNSSPVIRELLRDVDAAADVLVLAGDLTDTGLLAEMEVLMDELKRLAVPVVAVAGNHDHESDHAEELIRMLHGGGVHVLNGSAIEIGGVGFVGTKGFCGGFDDTMVQPYGERALKAFVQAGIDEAVALENAVTKLRSDRKVAVLHYSPVSGTLEGESPQLYPFLGSSRLANALDRHGVDFIVHGHAHRGAPESRTPRGIPVYNVSGTVQERCCGRRFFLTEL